MTPEKIKKWRLEHGYSQGKLAKALGVDVMTVSRWERGVIKTLPPLLDLALKGLEQEGKSKKKRGDQK